MCRCVGPRIPNEYNWFWTIVVAKHFQRTPKSDDAQSDPVSEEDRYSRIKTHFITQRTAAQVTWPRKVRAMWYFVGIGKYIYIYTCVDCHWYNRSEVAFSTSQNGPHLWIPEHTRTNGRWRGSSLCRSNNSATTRMRIASHILDRPTLIHTDELRDEPLNRAYYIRAKKYWRNERNHYTTFPLRIAHEFIEIQDTSAVQLWWVVSRTEATRRRNKIWCGFSCFFVNQDISNI